MSTAFAAQCACAPKSQPRELSFFFLGHRMRQFCRREFEVLHIEPCTRLDMTASMGSSHHVFLVSTEYR